MTRKPLPKVIRRTAEELQPFSVGAAGEDVAFANQRGSVRRIIETEPKLTVSSISPANDGLSEASMRTAWFMAKRRSWARKIVERHRTYAIMGGLAPIPIVNVTVLVAIIMRMVKRLSELYGVPYQQDRARSAIVGLMAGAAPTGFGAIAASTLAFIVPGPGFIGLAVSAATAGALTQGVGLIFMEHFEIGAGSATQASIK
jgi:uncharacterized protein (DUF697 family)